jgi:CubicO group peptidase (beta-lactamase class C family)
MPASPHPIADVDFSPVERALDAAIAASAFPGCAAAVGGGRGGAWLHGAGCLGEGFPAPARPDTLYDLASLTKVVAATAVAMTLVRDGLLDLERPAQDYVPAFRGDGREAVTLLHLLTHSAGLPAWLPLFEAHRSRDVLLAAVCAAPLEAPPGSLAVYSDLGIMLLGECLARAGGKPLAALAWERVFGPLGMHDTLYCPPVSERGRIAPTERDESCRRRMLHGEVHDENAWALGGVSAHAGLFSSAEDLARFGREVLRGLAGESRVFPRPILERFTRCAGVVAGSTRALGWDTRSESGSSAGHRFSKDSFGHTGFTGTSLWIDPARRVFAVLLSNRVHPTRRNQKIAAARVAFHDAVIESLEGA